MALMEAVRVAHPGRGRSLPWRSFAAHVAVAIAFVVPAMADPPRALMQPRHRDFLAEHCGECHGSETAEAGFRVDGLPLAIDSIEVAERWRKVLGALNSGEMPPADAPQPADTAKADFLDDLATTLVVARKSLADQHGRIAMRRLNQREYRNTLRDLLGAEVDVSDLPADTGSLGFDTVGANLFMTGSQFERYESIARDAIDQAVAMLLTSGVRKQLRFECESALPTIKKHTFAYREKQRQARRWFEALDGAIADPANAEVIAEIKRQDRGANLAYHWDKLKGMPPPEEFGFAEASQFNPGYVRAIYREEQNNAYEDYYFAKPGLDTGAYMAFPAPGKSPGVNVKLMVDIPGPWPPGDYVIRVRCGAVPGSPASRRFFDFGLRAWGDNIPPISTHHVAGTMAEPQVIEIPYRLTDATGDMTKRRFFFREIGTGSQEYAMKIFREEHAKNGIGPEFVIWVDWIEIERVDPWRDGLPPAVAAIEPLITGDAHDDSADASARLLAGLRRFAVEAWRGIEPTPAELDRMRGVYEARRAGGAKPDEALKAALVSILTAPRFLYRAEPGGDDAKRRLDGLELATRLSYFLWGGPPDPLLRERGASGKLLEPDILAEETDRLLADPRSRRFVEPFLFQWLTMDRLDLFTSNPKLFPRFTPAMRSAARREVYETFAHLLAADRPVSDLLRADYVVANALLADYYGLSGPAGDAYERVSLPAGSPRGGLLGMAAVHAMGSDGEHSNPVERGAWVLRKLLDDPPPPAPPNVPQLARLAGQSLTTRERVSLHQEAPQCANCHRKIDPIGFGMENFDAVGQWRTTDRYVPLDANSRPIPGERREWTIDPSGTLYGGPSFRDFFDLRAIVASKTDRFARGFTTALVEYALGRACGFSDEPLVDGIVAEAASRGQTPRAFVHALVQSDAFRSK